MQVVDCVSGVVGCGVLHDGLMQAAADRLACDAHKLNMQQVVDAAHAFSSAGVQSDDLFSRLAGSVQAQLGRHGVSGSQAATLAWAFALHGSPNPTLIPRLLDTAAVRVPAMDADSPVLASRVFLVERHAPVWTCALRGVNAVAVVRRCLSFWSGVRLVLCMTMSHAAV